MIDTMGETVVFACDAPEQRSELMSMLGDMPMRTRGLRVVALSIDNEVTRVGLIQEAVERYNDHTAKKGHSHCHPCGSDVINETADKHACHDRQRQPKRRAHGFTADTIAAAMTGSLSCAST
jgi:hypothetical protein